MEEGVIYQISPQSIQFGVCIKIMIGDLLNLPHLTILHFFSSTRRVEMDLFMITSQSREIIEMCWRVFMMGVNLPLWQVKYDVHFTCTIIRFSHIFVDICNLKVIVK